jgi:hypothetical protein
LQAKLNVLLMKCGLGDTAKIGMIRDFAAK